MIVISKKFKTISIVLKSYYGKSNNLNSIP